MKKAALGASLAVILWAAFFVPSARAASTYPGVLYSGGADTATQFFGGTSGCYSASHIERYVFTKPSWLCKVTAAVSRDSSSSPALTLTVRTGPTVPGSTTVVSMSVTPPVDGSVPIGPTVYDLPFCYSMASGTVMWLQFSPTGGPTANGFNFGYHTYDSVLQDWYDTMLGGCGGSPAAYSPGRTTYTLLNGSDSSIDTASFVIPGLPATSTSITAKCPDLGLFTPLCDGVMWAFVPDWSLLRSRVDFATSTAYTRFPFSYITQTITAFTASSATNTLTNVTFSTAGISSTSSFGAFLPSTITLFTTSTVSHYFSPSAWSLFRSLLGAVFIFAAFEYVYHSARSLFNRNQ